MAFSIETWFSEHGITEVEALMVDMSGIARGKIVPASKYLKDRSMRLPEEIFLQTVTGDYPNDYSMISPAEIDIVLKPDLNTLRLVPWAAEPTAQLIHDAHYYQDNAPVAMSPRYVLKHILQCYKERGWQPVIAPELEFFLVKSNPDEDYPLEPPLGRSGRAEVGRQAYSIDALNEFDPLFEDVYDYCEAQNIELDTLIHESGAAQMEINLLHGDPLELADQVFFFKRTVREAARQHNIFATFMAKPMERQPGSAMHIHQSVVDNKGQNIFSDIEGEPSSLFFSHIAGLQHYLPNAMPLLAPNVNSYRRITRYHAAPINVHWGYDNRTAGLRVPVGEADSRRVENRVAGADANPYLAIAASLACGYLGMIEQREPTQPWEGSAYKEPYGLPRSLGESLRLLNECEPLKELLGKRFVAAYTAVKECEYEAYFHVISSWERKHLLLNV